MAVFSASEIESKKPNNSLINRFLGKITITLLLLFIIFLWASSITIISSSVVHICVTSRKLIHLYCLSAGSQPEIYTLSLLSISNVSKVSVFDGYTSGFDNVVNGSQKDLVLYQKVPEISPLNCDGRGVYVYDLPSKFNKDLVDHCHDMINGLDLCQFFTNNGLGEPITELGKDWYNTNQYAIELIFHSHALNHPCRVYNPEEAKLFYVPFYGGLDILRWRFKDVSNDVKDSLTIELVEWLKKQNTWERNFGLDHVFVLGKSSWDFRRFAKGSLGTRLLKLDELQNPMKLLTEHHPWHINDMGIPHPTYFHPSSDEDILEWQSKISQVQRKNLISFAGAPHKAFDSIRSILIEQCTSEHDSTCKFFDCSQNACVNPVPVINLFMESEFCIHPDGDSAARKSIFDSMVAGCIPVVFDPLTAYYDQYPWHLPEDYNKYSVYIDKEEVRISDVNVIERLVKIPLKKKQEMRKYIIDELMPKLVYSDPNAKLEKFEDAFAISMNNLLEKVISRLP